MKNAAAVLLGLVLCLVLEGLLTALGVPTLAEDDPFVGFEGSVPLFRCDAGGVCSLSPGKERYFNPQSFPRRKPEGAFRLVSFGGSTTYGRPYLNDTSFTHWLQGLLSRYGDGRRIEAINAGGISYASYRVARLMEELAAYAPDLYIVYSGHNEFLESRTFAALKDEDPRLRAARALLHRSRLYSLVQRGVSRAVRPGPGGKTVLRDEIAAKNEEIGGPELYHRDPGFRAGVIRQYRHGIERMVALARGRGIPLILCTLPSNLSGVSPFKSEHRTGMTAGELERWEALVAAGSVALEEGRFGEALAALSEAEALDAEYALLHFLKGRALQALGRFGEGYRAFSRAKQEDIVPLRALDEFNEILREVAARERIPLADVEGVFRALSPGGIPGNPLFVDHVHPSIEGHQIVAQVILDAAVAAGLVPLPAARWDASREDARAYLGELSRAVPPRYRAMGLWGIGRLFFWAGKYPESYLALLAAWQSVRDVPEVPLLLGMLEVMRNDGARALEYLEAAERLGIDDPRLRPAKADAYIILKQGQRALEELDRVDARVPPPGIFSARGKALLLVGRAEEGLAALREAARLAPEVGIYHLNLAEALAASGRMGEAEERYRLYLVRERHPAPGPAAAAWAAAERRK
jgi:tetratricopeptide (TPR) repeat protein